MKRKKSNFFNYFIKKRVATLEVFIGGYTSKFLSSLKIKANRL
jgi:hypothetical protein